MNLTWGQQCASLNVGQKNLTGQWSRSNGSVRKVLILIYKSGVYWWDKNTAFERLPWLIQTMYPNCITLGVEKQGVHSVDVATLAPLFEKSATELKLKQKLLRCKNTVQIATLNIRTLNRIGHLLELTASAAEDNIDIQEHRYYHSEIEIKYHDCSNGWIFISASAWKNSINTIIGRVGMLLSPSDL